MDVTFIIGSARTRTFAGLRSPDDSTESLLVESENFLLKGYEKNYIPINTFLMSCQENNEFAANLIPKTAVCCTQYMN